MANAADNFWRDFGAPIGVLSGLVAAPLVLRAPPELALLIAIGGLLPALWLGVKLAIRRRRRRCREMHVDHREADRLFRRVDIFTHVRSYHRMSPAAQRELVDEILAGRHTGR